MRPWGLEWSTKDASSSLCLDLLDLRDSLLQKGLIRRGSGKGQSMRVSCIRGLLLLEDIVEATRGTETGLQHSFSDPCDPLATPMGARKTNIFLRWYVRATNGHSPHNGHGLELGDEAEVREVCIEGVRLGGEGLTWRGNG